MSHQLTFIGLKSKKRKHQKKMCNMFKVNNKNTSTPFWCFCCQLGTYFTTFSSVSIVDFVQVNISWAKYYYSI